jgi:hypothetical protein
LRGVVDLALDKADDLFNDHGGGLGELVSVNWWAELIAASTSRCRASWKRALPCWRKPTTERKRIGGALPTYRYPSILNECIGEHLVHPKGNHWVETRCSPGWYRAGRACNQ